MEIKPDEIANILRQRIEGLEADAADLSEVGTVLSVADGIARVHGLDNCMSLEMLELPHDVTGLALNLEADNVGVVLFGGVGAHRRGRHGEAHRPAARDPGRRGAARADRRPARPPARRQGRGQRLRDPSGGVQGSGRRRAPAGEHTGADRAEGDRRDDPDRPRPARADHRRPPDGEDGDRDRHDHQQPRQGPDLRLRRRSASGCRPWSRSPGCSTRPVRSTTRSSSPRLPTRRRRSSSWRPTPAARWPSTSSTTARTPSASTTT